MNKNFVIGSAIMGALGVALGAFGAHGLKQVLSENLLETYRTGIFYHLLHSVVLLAISLSSKYEFKVSYYLFFLGILFFSFSLYLYTLSGYTMLAMITPIGGILLISGWISIIITVFRNK